MKTVLMTVLRSLLVLVVAVAPAARAEEDPAAKEYARFEGTWKFASVEAEGQKLPEAQFKDSRLVLKGRSFTFTEAGATYKVDLGKSPKQIDITFLEGPEKGKTMLGIYELEGDTYKVCLGLTGKSRPTAFVSKPGSGHVLEVLKRVKP